MGSRVQTPTVNTSHNRKRGRGSHADISHQVRVSLFGVLFLEVLDPPILVYIFSEDHVPDEVRTHRVRPPHPP